MQPADGDEDVNFCSPEAAGWSDGERDSLGAINKSGQCREMNLSTRGSKKSRARCTRGLLRLIPIPIERAPWEFRKTSVLPKSTRAQNKIWLSRAAGAFCARGGQKKRRWIFFGVWAGSEKDIFLSKCCSRGDESLPGHAAYNFTPRRAARSHKSIRNSYMGLLAPQARADNGRSRDKR